MRNVQGKFVQQINTLISYPITLFFEDLVAYVEPYARLDVFGLSLPN